MEETIRKYGKVYRKALLFRHCREIEGKTAAYEARLREMYASDRFKAHSVYPTVNTVHVYAVIAMCLELKALGLSDAEIIETINHGFARRRNFFRRIIRAIDLLPNSFSIAKKWNISDHDKPAIRLVFNGATASYTPLIAQMAIDTGIKANICHASTRSIGEKAYGSMILSFKDINELDKATDYLAKFDNVEIEKEDHNE